IVVDPLFQQVAELRANDQNVYAFGSAVALSGDGNLLVVGAPGATVGSAEAQGAAYVFVRQSNVWSQVARLTSSDGHAVDHFGSAVSVNSFEGNTIVVGADNGDHPEGFNYGGGAAYVFVEPDSGWADTSTYAAKLTASDGRIEEKLGNSVAVSADGSTVVVGAPKPASALGRTTFGTAYIYVKPADSIGGWGTMRHYHETAQ